MADTPTPDDQPGGTPGRQGGRTPGPDDLRDAGERDRRQAQPPSPQDDQGGATSEPDDGTSQPPQRRKLEDRARDVGRAAGSAGTQAAAAYLTGGSSVAAQTAAKGAASKVSGAVGNATGEAAYRMTITVKAGIALALVAVLLLLVVLGGALGMGGDPWGGIEATDSALEEIDADVIEIYKDAARSEQVPWTVLAGLGRQLTEHGIQSPYAQCLRYRGDLPEESWTSTLYPRQEPYRCDVPVHSDTVTIVPFVDPPIGDYANPGQALGPMLLTPTAAAALADEHGWEDDSGEPHPAQRYAPAVRHVAQQLRVKADQVQADGLTYDPRSPADGEQADRFWAEAVNRLGDVVADPSGTIPQCGRPPLSDPPRTEEIGALVSAVFRCEAQRTLRTVDDDAEGHTTKNLYVVTGTVEPSGTFAYLSGQAAVDQLVDEALDVSYRYSGWDVGACEADGDHQPSAPKGIFPLADGPGCGDPVGNIETAAEMVVAGHTTLPSERDDSAGRFQPMEGGWAAIPDVFGNDAARERLRTDGPYDPPAAPNTCLETIGDRLLDVAELDGADTFANYANFEKLFSGFSDPSDLSDSALTQYFALRRTLETVGLRGDDRVGLDGDGPCRTTAQVDDRDFLHEYVAPTARKLAGQLSTRLLSLTGDGTEQDTRTDDGGEEGGPQAAAPVRAGVLALADDASEETSARDATPDDDIDVDVLAHQANVVQGIGAFLDDTHLAAEQPQPGTPLISRLHPDDHDDIDVPDVPTHLISSGAKLSLGDQVVRTASTYGGTLRADERRADDGVGGMPGTLPGCGTPPSLPPEATTADVAQMVYEVFYCQAVLLGLDAMPPAQGHPGSPHDPQALGMTNKAQQVASEAVVVSWCESVGYSARGDNGYGYAGVFQMGEAEAARWIPGYQPGTGMRDDPIANTLGAANYYFAGHGNPAAWDGWSPWAVVWTDYGGPNDHVVVPVLPRFASTDMDDNGNGTSYFGQFGPELPRWAVNPFVDGIVPTSYGGAPCGVAIGDGQPHTWPSQPDFAHVGAPTGEVLETLQPSSAGVVCPVPDTTDFYNDWAHARGGGSRPHTGTDVFADEGAPIVAPGDGTIEYVKNTNTGNSGLSVAILLDNGMRWVFVHNSGHPPGLAGGARVAAGETIGYIGRTGNAATTPPHAHTELRLDGRQSPKVNPYHYLADACPNAGGMPFAHPPMYLIDLLPEHGAVREMPWPDGQA